MAAGASAVVPSELLTLKDRLSRLTFIEACKLLGSQGREMIQRNANLWSVNIADDVHISSDLLRVRFPSNSAGAPVIVTISELLGIELHGGDAVA